MFANAPTPTVAASNKPSCPSENSRNSCTSKAATAHDPQNAPNSTKHAQIRRMPESIGVAYHTRANSRLRRCQAGGMFDVDTFIADCLAANQEAQPRLAVKEVLARAVSKASDIAEALPPTRAEVQQIHVSPELTVLKVVWAPGMTIRPHDHRMWASIGIYTGGEDNTFYRRAEGTLVTTGGKDLRPGDVCLLGDATIHSVANPTPEFAGAIHVYGGDFFDTLRSEFDAVTFEERPYDVDSTLRLFEEQNRLHASSAG